MLSFTRGEPVAYIKGGSLNKKKLRVNSDLNNLEDDEEYDENIDNLFDEYMRSYFKNKQKKILKYLDLIKLKKNIKQKRPPEDPEVLGVYNDIVKFIKMREGKEIKLQDDGVMVPIPRSDSREVIYISGPSESGKSTWCSNYLREYIKLFPNREIYLFSRLDEDPVLDEYEPTRILINEELLEDPIVPEELVEQSPEGCLVIFDDIDTLPKKLRDPIWALRDDILQIGRHYHITILVVTHQLMNYKETRTLLTESSKVVVFPHSGTAYHLRRFFKEYCGLDSKTTNRVLKLPTRWLMVQKKYPLYILGENICTLVS